MASIATASSKLRLGFGCALAALTLALAACGSKNESSSAPADPLAGLTVHVYTVRGEIIALPDAAQDLQVRHEAIAEFKNPDGSLGMNTMIMPFWPPQGIPKDDPRIAARIAGLSLDGLAASDKVELTFDVLWDADNKLVGYYATSVTPLPVDTALDFSPLEPAP